MKSRKTLFLIIILGTLLLVMLLFAQHMLRERSVITLPERPADADSSGDSSTPESLNVLRITPETVQAAVATLSRPASYQRSQAVILYWEGGKSTTTAQVAVKNGITRIDMSLPDGSVSHTLLTADRLAVWYDDEKDWSVLRADQISSDALQRMPTYETVLELSTSSIIQAEFCQLAGVYCIYIVTAPDADGYSESYWISVQSGLLYAAERTCNGNVVYRFSATEPDKDAPDEARFLLPDGSQF